MAAPAVVAGAQNGLVAALSPAPATRHIDARGDAGPGRGETLGFEIRNQGLPPDHPRRHVRAVTVGSPPVSAADLLLAAGVAFLAGGINSIAGGGSLILFPTLVALGMGTVAANVTNSVAQWPGYLGGVAGFRKEYAGQRSRILRFGGVAVLGGTAGSVLLLTTPSEAFDVVVPVLVLLATLLLAVQPLLTKRLKREDDGAARRDPAWLFVALFFATLYGGYFGGALGVILVGVLGVALHRLKLANALKSVLSSVTATVSLVVFGLFGPVDWLVVSVAAPASLVGGFLGARIATRIPATPLRILIVCFGIAVSIYLFARA
jgi:uncharacterized membrane protein YfcA